MKSRVNPYSEVLLEIEKGLWEHDFLVDENKDVPYEYDDVTFRACLKIFMSAVMWKIWIFMYNKPMSEKENIAEKVGNILRDIVLKFTGIDSHTLYNS